MGQDPTAGGQLSYKLIKLDSSTVASSYQVRAALKRLPGNGKMVAKKIKIKDENKINREKGKVL